MRNMIDVGLDPLVAGMIVYRSLQRDGFEVVEDGHRPIRHPPPGRAGPAARIEIDGGVVEGQSGRDQHLQQRSGRAVPPVMIAGLDHPPVLVIVHVADLCTGDL